MTILWQDGFDLYSVVADLNMAYFSSNSGTLTTTGGRFGGGAWFTNSYGLSRAITPSAEVWSSFALDTNSTAIGDRILAVFGSAGTSNSGFEVTITYNPSNGAFKAWRGNVGTLLGTATYFMTTSAWHWIDIRAKMSATIGEVEIWVDETQVMSLTGQNTINNAGQTQFTTVQLGDNSAGQALPVSIDDWFIYTSGTRLGDQRIETLVPTSDASPNQATPSTGTNHWAVVDEPQFNTSDYLTMAATSGNEELFGKGSISSTPASVTSVNVKLVSEKSDAGVCALIPLVVSSGTEGDGSAQNLITSWSIQSSIFETDPHTSAAWTYSAVNSASIGYKVN